MDKAAVATGSDRQAMASWADKVRNSGLKSRQFNMDWICSMAALSSFFCKQIFNCRNQEVF